MKIVITFFRINNTEILQRIFINGASVREEAEFKIISYLDEKLSPIEEKWYSAQILRIELL